MKKIPKKQLDYWIGSIGYQILDDIVAPECNISGIMADLYLASVMDYADDEKQGRKIIKKIYSKYKIPKYSVYLSEEAPIALLALAILECGEYKATG